MTNVLILTEIQEAMQQRYKQMLLERFPQLTINVVGHHTKVEPYIADIDVLMCFSPPMADHVVRDAPKLKWIQALGTGVDNIVDLPSLGKEVVVTNVRGIHGAPVSEATIAYMLSLARDLPRSVHAQDRSAWERRPAQLLAGKTVGILGVGLIAEYLAPLCKAFGMTVVGITGSPRPTPGFDRMVKREDLIAVAPELDFLVALIPMSAETHNIVGAKVFTAMKPTAYLVNVARGGVVDEEALVKALESGEIAGAALDVFSQEPLPTESSLWKTKGITLFPHLGGYSEGYETRAMPTLAGNMAKYLAGDLKNMINIVRSPASWQ
ncbi:D-2-hydroxyacid dehydrogenase [Pseudolabrys taiwanensis]|uniref:D-2-hydroxyacid dehydrogenase n=2 Tax=Pseudolabrys taiwanensis TaxID=331696 RepID=A0A345ZVC9_9HYPH|nr:D-2-hydroxyacid dehydrogenase [Pseudolabrys taiwanensis]AXK80876.1 D-2-hydroxyacid dehydrogenase [Pseudolabrys taiwanensis]